MVKLYVQVLIHGIQWRIGYLTGGQVIVTDNGYLLRYTDARTA